MYSAVYSVLGRVARGGAMRAALSSTATPRASIIDTVIVGGTVVTATDTFTADVVSSIYLYIYHKKYSLYYRCTRTKPCAVPFGPQRLCILLQKDSFPSLSRLSFSYDINRKAISGGKVLGVAQPGHFETSDSTEVIDAAGMLVLPGGVDSHCHIEQTRQMGGQVKLCAPSRCIISWIMTLQTSIDFVSSFIADVCTCTRSAFDSAPQLCSTNTSNYPTILTAQLFNC